MLVFRQFVVVSAGVIFALGAEASATAHALPNNSSDQPVWSHSPIKPLPSKVKSSPEVKKLIEDTKMKLLSQAFPDGNQRPTIPQISVPESLQPQEPTNPPSTQTPDLNPSANPLQFPTRPEEVEVEVVQPLTLEQAIAIALRNNQELQISRLNLQRAREQLREALADKYPNLDLLFDLTRADSAQGALQRQQQRESTNLQREQLNQDVEQLQQQEQQLQQLEQSGQDVTSGRQQLDIQRRGLDLQRQQLDDNNTTTDVLSGTLELNYNIYTGGRRPAQIRAAERQVRFNELDVERLSEDTRLNVANDYYDLQNTDAQVNIERAAIEDATQTLRDAQLLEQAGLGTRFDALQAEVELANANQNLLLALANQNTARRQLSQTLNVGANVGLTSADAIEEAGTWGLTLPQTIVLAFQNRAELEQFLLQREINQDQREIALSEVRPQVSLFANYNVLNDLDNGDTGFADGYSAGARLQWRLFDGGAARARADQENTDAQIEEENFSNQRDQVRLEVEQAYFNLQANQENIRTSERAVELAEESLRLARLRFQAGVGTQTEVIDAQSALTQARGNFLNAIIDYNRSFNQLQRAVSNVPDNRLFDIP